MKKIILSAIALIFVMAGSASALTFGLDSYSVTLNDTNPGLQLYYDPILLTPTSFDLEVGTQKTFGLFKIGTNERYINSDDMEAKDIFVAFDFSTPDVNGTAAGTTVGKTNADGDYGLVAWNNPTEFSFGNSGLFTITLDGGIFGTLGCKTIFATLKYETGDTAPVPEPSTILLLGAGLLGLVGYNRKRSSQKA